MKLVPALRLTRSENVHYNWGSEEELDFGSGKNGSRSPRSNNDDRLPSPVQNYGALKMKSKSLMSHLISPRPYSKAKLEDDDDFQEQRHQPAHVSPRHGGYSEPDQAWLGFEEQPSEAFVERRKHQQAAAIEYYMKNGMDQHVETQEELARMAGPKVIRADEAYNPEATGDDGEQGLVWVRQEQRKAERARSLSTGDKYDAPRKAVSKPRKLGKKKKGDDMPMLKYY